MKKKKSWFWRAVALYFILDGFVAMVNQHQVNAILDLLLSVIIILGLLSYE